MQRFVSVYQLLSRSGVQTGVALGACLLMVSAVPAAATTTARPDPYAAPSTRPAAGPEVALSRSGFASRVRQEPVRRSAVQEER
jgi:hypothetical protein